MNGDKIRSGKRKGVGTLAMISVELKMILTINVESIEHLIQVVDEEEGARGNA